MHNRHIHVVTTNVLPSVISIFNSSRALSTMDMLMKKLGSLTEQYLPTLLQILTCLTGHCAHLLSQRHLLSASALGMLKTIRHAALARFNQVGHLKSINLKSV